MLTKPPHASRSPDPHTDLAAFKSWSDVATSPTEEPVAAELIVAIMQSHYDDAALSISGSFGQRTARCLLITTHSNSSAAAERAVEDRRLAQTLAATTVNWPNPEMTGQLPRHYVEEARQLLSEDGYLLVAPAGVGRNVDHRATRMAAEELGCLIFWEDVAFWGIYGLSTDDRLEFSISNQAWLEDYVLIANPIDSTIAIKRWLLHNYPTQSDDVWRPLRYAWNVARESRMAASFAERFFVHNSSVEPFAHLLGMRIGDTRELPYGLAKLRNVNLIPAEITSDPEFRGRP